jgi:hypothetical protein
MYIIYTICHFLKKEVHQMDNFGMENMVSYIKKIAGVVQKEVHNLRPEAV